MLVDTGATVSVIRPDIVKKLGLQQLPTSYPQLHTAGDGTLPVKGSVTVMLELGGNLIEHEFLIVHIRDKGILGLDFLQKLEAQLDLPKAVLHAKGVQIQLKKRWQCSKSVLQLALETNWIEKALNSSALQVGTEEYEAAKSLFVKYKSIFADTGNVLGRTNIVQHGIDTGDAHPIKQAPRKIPYSQMADVDKMLREMIEQGVIEPSNSPWASPIVLVPKKDGTTRFCIDYRKLNAVTKKDSYALPCVQALMDTLSNSSWFCTLDLRSGYWQVALKDSDKEKTAFTLYQKGLWQFNVLPFGLCNAPATFQRLMETIIPNHLALVYLDDIIVHGPDFQTVLHKLDKVLQCLKEAGLQVRPNKCTFFTRETKYLGHIISQKGIRTDPEKTRAVQQWPVPKTKKHVRSFLGMCSYYRRFVNNFSEIARPLNRLTEARTDFLWDRDCQKSFDRLKQAMTNAPILRYPDFSKQFILDCDASAHGIGAVLSQDVSGKEQVVAYYSRALNRSEMNYCATRRELLAVVRSIEHFHQYLYGVPFVLRTDHAALKWLSTFKQPQAQLARWLETLQSYNFTIEHRRGRQHSNADGLSRRPCDKFCSYCSRREEQEKLVVNALDLGSEEIDQRDDAGLRWLIGKVQAKSKPEPSETAEKSTKIQQLVQRWESLEVIDGKLFHRWETKGRRHHWQWVVPVKAVPTVLAQCHSSLEGGHFGFWKTLGKIKQYYFWPGMTSDTKVWCKTCYICCKVKGPGRSYPAPLQQSQVGGPFQRIGMDILGPFPQTKRGNRVVLVLADYFTKWPEAIALPNQDAQTIASALVEKFISIHGVPNEVHTDQGRNFESKLMEEVNGLLGARRTRTTPLHPQSGGLVERLNRTLTKYLAMFVAENQDDWDTKLPLFLLAYRSAPQETTGLSPAQLVFGRDLNLPNSLVRHPPHRTDFTTPYAFRLREELEQVREFAHERMKVKMRTQKEHFDRRARQPAFKVGDWVWVHDPKRKQGICPKLQPQWTGPWIVSKKRNEVLFEVKMGRRKRLLHANRLARAQIITPQGLLDPANDMPLGPRK